MSKNLIKKEDEKTQIESLIDKPLELEKKENLEWFLKEDNFNDIEEIEYHEDHGDGSHEEHDHGDGSHEHHDHGDSDECNHDGDFVEDMIQRFEEYEKENGEKIEGVKVYRNDIHYCQFHKWYHLYKEKTIKSKIINLPDSFIEFFKGGWDLC